MIKYITTQRQQDRATDGMDGFAADSDGLLHVSDALPLAACAMTAAEFRDHVKRQREDAPSTDDDSDDADSDGDDLDLWTWIRCASRS